MEKKNFKVTPLPIKTNQICSAFPYLFTNPYSNCCIIGSKCTGKTTLLYNILKEACKEGMNVIIFCPTVKSDDAYQEIIKLMNKRKVNLQVFTHFIDPETGINRIDAIIEGIDNDMIDKLEEQSRQIIVKRKIDPQLARIMQFCNVGIPAISQSVEEIPEKVEKKINKKIKTTNLRPETIILIDDLSSSLTKHRILYKCFTANRHRKLMVLVASHSCIDLEPSAYLQLDYLVLYPNLPTDKILDLNTKIGLSDETDTNKSNKLLTKYFEATKKGKSKYDFLLIRKKENTFFRNFNEPI